MYLKTTKSKRHIYVQLIKGYRDKDGKVKHKVLINLGRLDRLQQDSSWPGIIDKFSTLMGIKNIVDINNCKAVQTLNWGYLVYKKIWGIFKMEQFLSRIQKNKRTKFDLNASVFLMVAQHLLNPCSKLRTYNKQKNYIQYPKIETNHLYRSLDIVSSYKEEIERHIFNINRDVFNMRVDIVFYDVTTFYFESVKDDRLKNFGFSKDNKVNEVQVVFGMFIDSEGRPIGYELFPGNTFDGKTLDQALESIEKRFGIRNVIIVADRGINSKINLKNIVDKGYGYIVASRIKNLDQKTQQKIFDKDGYETIKDQNITYKVIDYVNKSQLEKFELSEKLIITYSEKRAKKDRKDRKRLLDKASYLLANPSLIKNSNKRGGKKYIKDKNQSTWSLDLEAIDRDEKFDGYYGIQTNTQDLNIEKILDAYHTLWKIEESFKVMKSTLEVRPIFHWTENRIKGHFVICFLAFLLERTMEFTLHQAGIHASTQDIRDALNSMQFTETEYRKERYLLAAPLTELGLKILSTQKIKPPPNSMPSNKFDAVKFMSKA